MTDGVLERLSASLSDRYRIERELGAGGMATVYLAHDLKHERPVAIKVLHQDLAAALGAERFLAEIKTTARLQHPHILPLLDSGSADGLLYYVMPFVAGESLRDRLNREKQLPIDDAVRIAREVADALGHAHSHDVIHRDIKPENILLQEGHALVADFGIALAVQSAGGQRMTQTGLSLGTPQYMSPEQAMGEKAIDARADIYALGAVTYEMLTGEPPFTGATVQAIVAKVLGTEPARPSDVRRTIPPHIEGAVLTALAKLPADRFASALEFTASIRGERTTTRADSPASRFADVSALRWKQVSVALGTLAVALAIVLLARLGGAGTGMPKVLDLGLPDSVELAFASGDPGFSVSPREDFIVYTVRRNDTTSIWRRDLSDGHVSPIAGTQHGSSPRISPDGQRIAFRRLGGVSVVPVAGGPARQLIDIANSTAIEWVSSSRFFVVDQDGRRLRWMDPESGQLSEHTIAYCLEPSWIERSHRFLCGGGGVKHAYLLDSTLKDSIRLTTQTIGGASSVVMGSSFTLVDDRYIVYISLDGDLRAASFDAASNSIGRSVTLVSGVQREAYSGAGQYRIMPSGALIFAAGGNAEIGQLVKVLAGRSPEPLPIAPTSIFRWDMSRDGRRLAAAVQAPGYQELRIYDLRDGRQTVWFRANVIGQPLWSPDGTHIIVDALDSAGAALLIGSPSSGLAPDTLLALSAANDQVQPQFFPSERLVFASDRAGRLLLSLDPSVRPVRFDTLVKNARFAAPSPDGKRLAYQGTDRGDVMVYDHIRHRRVQLAASGTEPLWLGSSAVLYRTSSSWYLAHLDPQSGELMGTPQRWLRDPRFTDTPGYSTRNSPDGGFTYVQGPEQVTAPYFRMIPHWTKQMKRLVDEANKK